MPAESSSPLEVVINVVIKNPGNASVVDFKTQVLLSMTVGDLKAQICREYEGNPPPSSQRLIFSGSLLRDEGAHLADVLRSVDHTAPQIFHMVVSATGSAASSPVRTPGAAATTVGSRRSPLNDGGGASPPPPPWTFGTGTPRPFPLGGLASTPSSPQPANVGGASVPLPAAGSEPGGATTATYPSAAAAAAAVGAAPRSIGLLLRLGAQVVRQPPAHVRARGPVDRARDGAGLPLVTKNSSQLFVKGLVKRAPLAPVLVRSSLTFQLVRCASVVARAHLFVVVVHRDGGNEARGERSGGGRRREHVERGGGSWGSGSEGGVVIASIRRCHIINSAVSCSGAGVAAPTIRQLYAIHVHRHLLNPPRRHRRRCCHHPRRPCSQQRCFRDVLVASEFIGLPPSTIAAAFRAFILG
mmetsp:Transcript_34646/g.86953  ORF Transcript_34646/g.86953 Transcript_34646/m.86953 type:complete len:413 (-) Transcript_34646:92-1330(-)